MSEMLELDEASAIVKCSIETLHDNLRSGHLPGTKFGASWVIPRRAFFDRLNEIAVEEAAQRRIAATPKPVLESVPRTQRRNALASV